MSQIDADVLLPSPRLRELALAEEITQLHRGDVYAEEGDTFEIEGTRFEVTEVTARRLGDLTDEDARAEGSPDLDAYRRRLDAAHENFEWDDDAEVHRHRFEQVE